MSILENVYMIVKELNETKEEKKEDEENKVMVSRKRENNNLVNILDIIIHGLDITSVVVNNIKDEIKKQQIRSESLTFFSEKCNLPIIYSSKLFQYAPDDYEFDNKNYCIIGTTIRTENNCDKYNLPIFNMLVVSSANPYNYVDPIFTYLKDYCKADMSKIGIVSITENNNLGLVGLEPYKKILNKYGIIDKNILIRQDVQTARDEGYGDGYWKSPNKLDNQFETFSIQFPLKDNADISNYCNKNEWLELGESSFPSKNNAGFGIGMERIEYCFFGIKYPRK